MLPASSGWALLTHLSVFVGVGSRASGISSRSVLGLTISDHQEYWALVALTWKERSDDASRPFEVDPDSDPVLLSSLPSDQLDFQRALLMAEIDEGVSFPLEKRGHLIFLHAQSGYVYCARCHISRRAKDWKYACNHDCAASERLPRPIGSYCSVQAHHVRIVMTKWKSYASRPSVSCMRCKSVQWATAMFRSGCKVRS